VKAGGVGDPLRSDEGYQILRVDVRDAATNTPTFDENKMRESVVVSAWVTGCQPDDHAERKFERAIRTPGSTLAASGIFSGVTNLWMQPLDGGPPKQLTNFASESFFALDWSRDGKLVYGRGETTSDAVLISDFR